MKKRLAAAAAILLLLGAEACAHRLDEYLQATIICVEQNQLHASMRLVPGVAVSSRILEAIDTNHDGVLSQAEQSAYAEQVLRDLSITVNGKKTVPQLVSQKFPTAEEVKEGLGEIQIEFTVNLSGDLKNRKIVFENHHQNTISAYLVNCLVPRDPGIRILAQNRNETQSIYQLDIAQAGGSSVQSSDTAFLPWWLTLGRWSGGAGFRSLFRLGMRHIAEGTDHLLFLLALLLPAPLLVIGSRWAGFAGVRHSLLRILKIVTAFTVGHSITLALAALGAVDHPCPSSRSPHCSFDFFLRAPCIAPHIPGTRNSNCRILWPRFTVLHSPQLSGSWDSAAGSAWLEFLRSILALKRCS